MTTTLEFQVVNSKEVVIVEIEEALDRFLVQLRADGRSEHTVRQYQRHVRALAAWLLETGCGAPVAELGHEVLARFLASGAARTRADGQPKRAGSVNSLRSSLAGFFDFVHRAGYATENATRLVRRARTAPPPPRGLSHAEQGRLLASIDGAVGEESLRDGVLVRLMLGTGLRLSSALALDVDDVDLERSELHIRRLKGGGEQIVFLGDALRDRLATHIAARTDRPLFQGCTGRRLGHWQAQRRFAQWLEQARLGARFSAHSCRHAFAMSLYARTGDVLLVKEALGHASIGSTLIYARATQDRVRKAVTAL